MQLVWRTVKILHNWCAITYNLIKNWIKKDMDFSLNWETQNLAEMHLSSTSHIFFIFKSQMNSICQTFLICFQLPSMNSEGRAVNLNLLFGGFLRDSNEDCKGKESIWRQRTTGHSLLGHKPQCLSDFKFTHLLWRPAPKQRSSSQDMCPLRDSLWSHKKSYQTHQAK